MGFLSRAGQILLGAAVVGVAAPSCYSAGAGTAPPPDTFYFPVGLAVSSKGSVLYAVNSDFDLQWNGGTLQSYDLDQLRTDAVQQIAKFALPLMPCPGTPPAGRALFNDLGEQCAPITPSQKYFEKSVIIGAFATDVQISVAPGQPTRLFIPVRGSATVTWADIGGNGDPFEIDCGQGADNRCAASHEAGNDPNQLENTRQVTMPGEPYGMAQSGDGSYLVVTSQTTTQTSLLTTGFSVAPAPSAPDGGPPALPALPTQPTMEYVLGGMPNGGIGVAAVPHDQDAPAPGTVSPPGMTSTHCDDPTETPPCLSSRCEDVNDAIPGIRCVRPAFLETSRSAAEIDLLRLYDDDGSSSLRPFLQREGVYPITSNALGTDSRGIVIDPTPRIACKQQCSMGDQACRTACAQLAARVFFASRTPPALGIGEIGGPPPTGEGGYDPDRLVLTGNQPLPFGPSNVYLAPIIDANGNLALRVFIVCFDSSQIVIWDPDAQAVENVINVGAGPFAMTFDPFQIWEVGRHIAASSATFPNYRFAYVASFTQSYVQMIDLDNHQPTTETFENIVFTLGQPTLPKGQ